MLQSISTYLLYAKEKYGAEPDYFSFNEPNIGCRVAFDADEHRAVLKRVGACLAQAGLKTKLLLGDVGCPRDTLAYTVPAAEDPQALQYVGALSVHSWGGATPEQYGEWAACARKLSLPLLVAEAGPDPGAYVDAKFQSFQYGMLELAHYQDLFLHASPQVVLFWEFTGDYSLLAPGPADHPGLQLTERFCFQKHWCDLTPPGSEALATTSDKAAILFTAFRFAGSGTAGLSSSVVSGCTLHLANTTWTRRVTIQGLPRWLKTLNVVRTSRGELFKRQEPRAVLDGELTLELPGQSLTSLTTLPIPELREP